MDSERWKRIDSLLQAALEHPPEERDAFLRKECAGDAALESEVRSLLASQQNLGDFMESPAMEVAARSMAEQQYTTASDIPTVTAFQPNPEGGRFGPYRVEQKLGSGGMGDVFRAVDTRLGRSVAIKTCREGFGQRFQREAKAISSLNHPYICTLYDVGPDYLVMELIEGETLAARLKRGRLSMQQALQYGSQIAEALSAAHVKGIVHRDLKPGNIMITKTGVKVLDFGLARTARDQTITAGHEVVGTPAYMSPEQLEGREAGERTDIYALGLVIREMLTGNRQGKTADLPAPVAHVVERCLEVDPEERWQAASDVSRELTWAARSLAATPGPRTPRRTFGWAVIGVGALAVLAAVLWFRTGVIRSNRPVRISVGLTKVDLRDDTYRMDDTLLHREQPGTFMALSPDGTRLVVQVLDVSADAERTSPRMGTPRLAMRRLDEAQFRPIPGTEDPTGPFFSPDGKWIAFFGNGKLRKIPVDGGAPVMICESGNFPSGSWGDDDNIVAALSIRGGLSRVPSSGGRPVPLTELKPGEVMHRWPQILPHSRSVLFTSYTGGGPEDANLEVLSLQSGERKTLLKGAAMGRYVGTSTGSAYLVYLRRHALFAVAFDVDRLATIGVSRKVLDDVSSITPSTPGDFVTGDNGTFVYLSGKGEPERSIFWLDEAGAKRPLRTAPGIYNGLRLSPDGRLLAFNQGDPLKQQDLWVQNLETNAVTRVTRLAGSSHSPVWWPNGRYILFGVWNQPDPGLYWVRSDGTGEPRLLVKDDPIAPSAISSDGQVLVQTGNPMTKYEVSTLSIRLAEDSLVAGKRTALFGEPGFSMPALSPDGHWIAYGSAESGTDEVYVRPFPGPGPKVAISAGGGIFPTWSPDGRKLFFMASNHIMVVDCATQGGSFRPGKVRVWTQQSILDTGGPFQPYALAPDGKRFAVMLYPDGTGDPRSTLNLTYVLNFADMLKERLSGE